MTSVPFPLSDLLLLFKKKVIKRLIIHQEWDQFWTPCQISVMIENGDNCVTKKFSNDGYPCLQSPFLGLLKMVLKSFLTLCLTKQCICSRRSVRLKSLKNCQNQQPLKLSLPYINPNTTTRTVYRALILYQRMVLGWWQYMLYMYFEKYFILDSYYSNQ